MLRAVLALAALAPASAGASTVDFWYLSGEATRPFGAHTHNTGVMRLDAERYPDLAGITLSFFANDIGDPGIGVSFDFPIGLNPHMAPSEYRFDITFDQQGMPETWMIGNRPFGPTWFVNWFIMDSEQGDMLMLAQGPLEPVTYFEAPAGTWFADEYAYNQAAIAAGVAPIPIPAAGWLMLAGLGGLGWLARRSGRG